jgi:hypothetical protein
MRDVNPTVDVPPALEQAVLQAMEKHREHRFATATAFLQALEDAELGGEPVVELDAWGTAPHDARTTAANAAAWLARTTGRLGDRRWRRAWTAMALVVGVAVTVAVFRKPRHFSAATHAVAPASVHATTTRPPFPSRSPAALAAAPEAMPPPLSRTAAEEEVDQLARTANEGSDLPRRLRAAAKLEELGNRDRVDQVSLTILELKQARTCEQRKSYVDKLRAMGDPRALPALRGLHGLRLGRLVRVGGANTGCMKKELAAAIKTLESKS